MLSDSVLTVLVSSFILLVSLCNAQTAPITDSFNKEDTERVAALAMNTLSNPTQHDLATLFYASSIVKGLGQQVKSSKPVCDFVKSKVAASASQLQNAYYIAGISKALSCAVSTSDFLLFCFQKRFCCQALKIFVLLIHNQNFLISIRVFFRNISTIF